MYRSSQRLSVDEWIYNISACIPIFESIANVNPIAIVQREEKQKKKEKGKRKLRLG